MPARVAKVAFLFFLTHASLPEALWARFFKGAPRAQYTLYTHVNPMCEALSKPNPRNCSFGAGSLFAESAATDARGEPLAIRTARFSFSLVEVERGLLAAALRNPHNAAFVLLSETSVPLWPFQTMRRAVLLQPAMVGAWRDSSAPIAWLRTIEGQWARPERRKHFRRWAEGKHLRALSYLAGTTAAFQRRVNGASWGKASQWWTTSDVAPTWSASVGGHERRRVRAAADPAPSQTKVPPPPPPMAPGGTPSALPWRARPNRSE